jgi:hypothetical protein
MIRVLLDGGASPWESATACWSNGILAENFRQRVKQLTRIQDAIPPSRLRATARAIDRRPGS